MAQPAPSAATPSLPFSTIIFNCQTADLAAFDRAAATAKSLGATHMVVTSDLPRAQWEYDTPGDPYPAWYVEHPGLLKVFPPDELRPYVSADYAAQISGILIQRCAVLKKYGLQGVYLSNEPQVLPEKAFTDHPLWRGPRVDQPNRSRVPRFAPSVDEPQVLALYRQCLAELAKRCPEITLFEFLTTDSGSGIDWAPSLYPGANGPARFKARPMADRVRDFLTAMQDGARDGGGRIQIRLYQINPEEWMTPTFADPQGLARQLPAGLAIDNFEAPSAAPFLANASSGDPNGFYYPVRGIPRPIDAVANLRAALSSPAPRLNFGIPLGCEGLYPAVFQLFAAHPARTTLAQAQLVHDLAVQQVGEENADNLIGVWEPLANAAQVASVLKWCYPFNMGGVHQRWITRPFVPFPNELPADQKAYYRKFLFEARSEDQADDLTDNQAMELYKGWAGRMSITNVFNYVEPQIKTARRHLADLIAALPAEKQAPYEDLDLRLQMTLCLCANARDAVNYQAALEYIKSRNAPPDGNPPLGAGPSWDRQMILEIARNEIDNSAAMIDLLKKSPDLIYHAKTADEEDIMLLGPDVAGQLKTKIDIMNAHWEDYNRITTVPNP
ncbi:MAG: hypothetical protein ABSH22_22780 [Tepidisphaeraceae bacterium]